MRIRDEEAYRKKKEEIMKKCYECYAEYGLSGVGVKKIARTCGYTPASLYIYFEDLDDLIVQSTEYCMSKVEDEFMEKAPKSPEELMSFIDEVPYWTAEKHGKKYRLMYQIYTHPKYIEHGKKFFEGVNERYSQYAKFLEEKISIPHTIITPLILVLIRACVHYALFEDESYLQMQLDILKKGISLFMKEYATSADKKPMADEGEEE